MKLKTHSNRKLPSRTMPDHNRCNNEQHIKCYLEQLEQNQTNARTLKTYTNALKCFLKFLAMAGITELKDTTSETVQEFRNSLIEAQFSIHSIDLYLRVVKQFYNWLSDEAIIFMNPADNLVIPKPPRHLGMVLSDSEVKKLFEVPDLSTPIGIRDRALLETAYASATRIAELAGLNVYDVDFSEQTIRVMGKFSKERILPIGRHAARYLQQYIREARPILLKNNTDCQALWISHLSANGITLDGLSQRFQALGESAGLKDFSCHTLRRSCATAMLRNGASPEILRRFLGHNSMKTLAQYLNVTITDIKRTHAACNPGK